LGRKMKRSEIESAAEDREDYLVAVTRLENEMPAIPLDEVIERLGLDEDPVNN
jgi:hypothetical protein